ncbi:MAG: cell division protein FtsA [Chthoniobacteraceae bacterium]
MSSEDFIVGLEIGTSKVCAVVAEGRPDGTIKINGVGQAPSRGVRKSGIVDFETAGKCVREALADAEEKSDVMIGSVYLAVTGGHIESFNNRGMIIIPEDRDEICDEDFVEVQTAAREVSIPAPNQFLHSILQHYYVDGQDGVLNPIGMMGRKLEADFHIVHGVGNRIKNSIRCVKELDIDVEDVVFGPLASAQVVLDSDQKNQGALVIDIGAGTTGYVMYADGGVKHSGCLDLGGDHVTNDLSLGLRIPMARAERLKIDEGSVRLGHSTPGERILLKDETGFAGKEIEREMLNTIIHCRVRETFELVKKQLDASGARLDFLGAGVQLTGGSSMLKGINELAEDVFGQPVHVTCVKGAMSGPTSAFENPQYSCAIGVVKYAHAMTVGLRRPNLFRRIARRIPFLNNLL